MKNISRAQWVVAFYALSLVAIFLYQPILKNPIRGVYEYSGYRLIGGDIPLGRVDVAFMFLEVLISTLLVVSTLYFIELDRKRT